MHAAIQEVMLPGTVPPRYELFPRNEWWEAGENHTLTDEQAALLLKEGRVALVDTP